MSAAPSQGIVPIGIAAFAQMPRRSARITMTLRDSVSTVRRSRDGFVMGEGCSILVLESLEHAIARDAPIYAEVLGSSVASDAFDVVAPDPSAQGEVPGDETGVGGLGCRADEIDYISAHATSTVLGDNIEARAIKKLFGERGRQFPSAHTNP